MENHLRFECSDSLFNCSKCETNSIKRLNLNSHNCEEALYKLVIEQKVYIKFLESKIADYENPDQA